MNDNQKFDKAMEWFCSASKEDQYKAFRSLIEYGIQTEAIGIWDDEDRIFLSNEEGKDIKYFMIPYFTFCGSSIIDD